MITKAIRFHAPGGPEVLKLEDVEVGDPGPGEIRVRHHAIGVNFIDIYFRTGAYPQPLPGGIGTEAAGVVEAVGPGVTHIRVGDRIGYASRPPGAYAQARVMPAAAVFRLPDTVDDQSAAAVMLQGMTVEYLLHRTFPLNGGETILFHAAAGGVGLLACQWAKALGVTMIGTVSTDEKAALAKSMGCTHTINYSKENVAERVRELTGGKGVPVVYDGVGKDTFQASIDSLAIRGMLVSFGSASGPVPPVDPALLAGKGSLYFTRPTLFNYNITTEDWSTSSGKVFAMMTAGKLKAVIGKTYPLAEAAQAQIDLASRKTTGSLVLLP